MIVNRKNGGGKKRNIFSKKKIKNNKILKGGSHQIVETINNTFLNEMIQEGDGKLPINCRTNFITTVGDSLHDFKGANKIQHNETNPFFTNIFECFYKYFIPR